MSERYKVFSVFDRDFLYRKKTNKRQLQTLVRVVEGRNHAHPALTNLFSHRTANCHARKKPVRVNILAISSVFILYSVRVRELGTVEIGTRTEILTNSPL